MIFLIEESYTQEPIDKINIIESKIDILEQSLYFQIGVEDGPARLSDIVPLAYAISDKLCDTVIEHITAYGGQVSCRKGCSCCCDYLIPLSLPEVYYIQAEIGRAQEEIQIPILCSCVLAARKILNYEKLTEFNIISGDLSRIGQWYENLKLPCPFLIDDVCKIYSTRPLACREHLVTGSSEMCQANHKIGSPDVVNLPVSMLEVLGQLAADSEQSNIEAVLLPLALACMDSYSEGASRTWSAISMTKRFVGILESMSKKCCSRLVEAS